MNHKKYFVLIPLFAALIYGAYQFANRPPAKPKAPEAGLKESPRRFSPYSGEPVTLPKDRSLDSYSGDDLLALMDELGKVNANKEVQMGNAEYIVNSGDTVVTKGYESAPGVFIISTIKFEITGSSAAPKIAFKINRARLSLGGEYTVLIDDKDEIDSGIGGYGANNDRYRIYFKGTVLPNGKQIKVTVKESEFEKSRIKIR